MEANTEQKKIIFLHSLFRSGSTYIYNTIKRTGLFHAYHEPMHEVIASLPEKWGDLAENQQKLKYILRHEFLTGSYFDEYSHFLPEIEKTFEETLSFDFYFMHESEKSIPLKNYIDLLIEKSLKTPVIQCTRTSGRIDWLKHNYPSKHVFLLRNPWDQWFSYKVDPYISITPQLAYSSKNTPNTLKKVLEVSGISITDADSIHEKTASLIRHPIDSNSNYLLFFGLWAHAFISGLKSCDVFIDMDKLSASENYRGEITSELNLIGLGPLDFSDVALHRTVFKKREIKNYEVAEDRVLEIFEQHGIDTTAVREYMDRMRLETFREGPHADGEITSAVEDAARMRELLRARDDQLARSASDLIDRDRQLIGLNQRLAECGPNFQQIAQPVLSEPCSPHGDGSAEASESRLRPDTSIRNENSGTAGAQAFFTICSKNFLAHARVLHDSVKTHYPNTRFLVALCDRVDGLFDPTQEPFEFIYPEELEIPDFPGMAKRYNITELNTSIKPFVFLHIMEKLHLETVVYLDPDIYLVSKMEELDSFLEGGAEAALTPHILNPAENDEIHDGKMLLFGIYNLGFLALRHTKTVQQFLAWWGRRLERACIIRLEEGLFVDQKWADLLPSFVPGTKIIHHAGYNVAYWNLPQRKISLRNDIWLSNTEKLRFVHFSGNKLDDETVFSRHSQQVNISNIGDLRILLDAYRKMVRKQGHDFYRKLPYAYSWNGASNINLHTPKELDISSRDSTLSTHPSGVSPNKVTSKISAIVRRAGIIRRSLPLAKSLSGGWGSLIHRALRAYRVHGWSHVKSKAIELSNYRTPPPTASFESTEKNSDKNKIPRLLYIDWAIPKPDQDAASVTAKLLMEIADSLGYQVTFIPCNLKYEEGYYEALKSSNIEVITHPEAQSVSDWLTKNAIKFDICILARGPVSWPYLSLLKKCAPSLRLIFNTVDLHYLRELRQADLCRDESARSAALKMRDQEFDLIHECDATILLSQEEMYSVREVDSETALQILPVVFSDIPGSTKPFHSRKDILFIGSFPHQPNIDAVLYFAEFIYPIVKNKIPDITFKVVGSNPPESVQKLSDIPGIEILGFVKDLDPLFSKIRLSIAPLRYGAGIKGKIGTSLCYGVPCVATPIAIEGMGLTNGSNILVGATPEEFAEAICSAYLDEETWVNLSSSGHQFAVDNYSVPSIRKRLSNLLNTLQSGWKPIFGAVEITGWENYIQHAHRLEKEYLRRVLLEQSLLPKDGSGSFETKGFCCICNRESNFLTSFMYSTSQTPDGRQMPNWREHMQCQHCGLVNRVRAGLHAMHTYAKPETGSRIYITEKLTETYKWLTKRYQNVLGSEYYGPNNTPGSLVNGVQHEDLMNLSLPDAELDFIVSFDVLEHVPQPDLALQEIYRTLAPGGSLIFTAPFSSNSNTDLIRASLLADGSIEHHCPAEYHGNPVDPEGGALCFRYFSWNMLERMRHIGFKNVRCLSYWSEKQGYLGTEQFLFLASK